ncbi:hypothetical protein [Intrasporangium chromatireducens]|nr:hypothetical protein [Intrasporangium chromatireducens]
MRLRGTPPTGMGSAGGALDSGGHQVGRTGALVLRRSRLRGAMAGQR